MKKKKLVLHPKTNKLVVTHAKNLLKEQDNVIVISGQDKKKVGRLLRFDRKRGKVKVENINMKTSYSKEQGITRAEGWMPVCKVMFFDEKTDKPARLKKDENGNRVVREKKKNG